MSSAVEDEKERELKMRVCEKTATGEWVVNKSKLKAFVEAEAFSFEVCTGIHELELEFTKIATAGEFKKTVFLLTHSRMHSMNAITRLFDVNPPVAWLYRTQIRGDSKRLAPISVYSDTHQCAVLKWLTDDSRDCVVCYEPTDDSSLERRCIFCECGTVVCFGCVIDLISMTGMEMAYECPNCRLKADAFHNLMNIIEKIDKCVQRRNTLAVSEEHSDLIEKTTSIDLTLSREQIKEQTLTVYTEFEKNIEQLENEDVTDSPEISTKALYKDFCKTIARIRKKKVVRASAEDSSSALAVRSRFGCANCGKRFWDKSDWRRAPKCTKCQRTAYCCAKCRKRHWKTHASHCAAMKPKKKRKAKRKPKKGGCAPF